MSAVSSWTKATGSMPWGVQSAFKTALEAVAAGDIKMVYGADSYKGSPCLVNAINQMIHKDAGASPSQFASAVVSSFDALNTELFAKVGAPNTDKHFVTPFAAEVLLKHFGAMAPQPIAPEPQDPNAIDSPYIERSDEDLMNEWVTANAKDAANVACPEPTVDVTAQVENFLAAIAADADHSTNVE